MSIKDKKLVTKWQLLSTGIFESCKVAICLQMLRNQICSGTGPHIRSNHVSLETEAVLRVDPVSGTMTFPADEWR